MLAADAKFLLDAERFASAAGCAALSIEESGKNSILRRLALASDAELTHTWKEFRSHKSKNAHWILMDLARQGARTLDDLAPIFSPSATHPELLDKVKQISFYVDCYGEKQNWSEPTSVIDIDLAKSLVIIADVLSKGGEDVSSREIELWIAHVGPSAMTLDAKGALLRWSAAMHAEGLTQRPPSEFASFIFGGKPAS